MTVKSLRETLNGLSADWDDHTVLFCKSITKDGERLVSLEEPLMGSMVMEERDVFFLMSEDAMDYMQEQNPHVEKDTSGEWIQGEF